jgi:hypothetical protein
MLFTPTSTLDKAKLLKGHNDVTGNSSLWPALMIRDEHRDDVIVTMGIRRQHRRSHRERRNIESRINRDYWPLIAISITIVIEGAFTSFDLHCLTICRLPSAVQHSVTVPLWHDGHRKSRSEAPSNCFELIVPSYEARSKIASLSRDAHPY